MERINCYALYALGKHMGTLSRLSAYQSDELQAATLRALTVLEEVFRGDSATEPLMDLSIAQEDANAVINSINVIRDGLSSSPPRVDDSDINHLHQSIFRLEIVLSAALARASTYYVGSLGVLSIDRLIDGADAAFNVAIQSKLPPEALDDTKQAGRCLAFDLPTAAGFHICRATESVILKYYDACGCPPLKESQRNWGHYIKELETASADKRITAALTALRILHRNPMVHPEDTLVSAEAVQLFSLCTSVIISMMADIENKSTSPNTIIQSMLPPARI